MNNKIICLRLCGVSLIVCAALPLLLYNSWAFSSEYMLQWVVSFNMIAGWSSYPFSVSKLVGICYRISLWLPFFLIPLGAFFVISPKTLLLKNKVKRIIEFCIGMALCAFYLFAITVNIIRLDRSAYTTFYLYILTEITIIAVLLFTAVLVLRQQKSIKEKDDRI